MTFGHYRVLRLLGRGGMGEIHLARDEMLDRLVALKTVPASLVADEAVRRRVLREARAAAALSHPFICPIHEVLDHEGQPVIVMGYVDGETVGAKVQSGPLPAEMVCRVGAEIAEALGAAHARGILHRDVSAGNVMIGVDGHAKVMDFGLAQLKRPSDDQATRTITGDFAPAGSVAGTPAFMAPEILTGAAAGPHSDLYSLGVVLYLMATGRLPFEAPSTPAMFVEILTGTAVQPSAVHPSVPPALDRVIMKLLDRDPSRRFESGALVADALAQAASPRAAAAQATPSVAVLPFTPLGSREMDAGFGLGLADATITDLAVVRSLLVRPTAAILAYRDRVVDPLTAGRELSVDAVVSGSFQQIGSRIRVTVQLVSIADGRSRWGTKIDTNVDDVFKLQDEVSKQIVQALEVQLTAGEEVGLRRGAQGAGAAQREYMRGRVALLTESLASANEAIDAFERALAIDPSFAPAYAGLSSAYSRIAFTFIPEPEHYRKAVEMCERALTLDPTLPEARYVRGLLNWTPHHGFQHAAAIRELSAAIAARPNLGEAFGMLALIVLHVGLVDEAQALLDRALAIDPQDRNALLYMGSCHYLRLEFERAHQVIEESWRRFPTAWTSYLLALLELHLGRTADAERMRERSARQFPENVLFYPLGAITAALSGDASAAEREIEQTVRHRRDFGHYHHAQYDVACALALLGRRDEAVDWLADAAKNGFPCHPLFARDPWLESVWSLPRFADLQQALAAECAEYESIYREVRIPNP